MKIDIKKIINKSVSLLKIPGMGKKKSGGGGVRLETIWKSEVIFASILLTLVFTADFLLYQNFAANTQNPGQIPDSQVPAALHQKTLKDAGRQIKADSEFIDSPSFNFVKNPF